MPSGSTTAPDFQPELLWPENPGQFDYIVPPSFDSNGGWDGQTAPEYGAGLSDYTNIGGCASYPAEWSTAQPALTLDWAAAAVLALPTSSPTQALAVPGTILGKRPRGDEDPYNDGSPSVNDGHSHKKSKRKMGTTGVLGVAGTTSKTRHKPVTRTPVVINGKSKMVGHGAERLVSTTAQGVYHQPLPGPSAQQALVGTTAPGQLTWVEESVVGGSWHHHSSVVQKEVEVQSTEPDGEGENASDELFWVPRRLDARHRALLVATPSDWQRKAVDELKCRLCPGADFSDWEDYKRHCDTSESHPAKISYCGHCGDFFARNDALKRHREKRPPECICTTAEVAKVKRTETARVFEEFKVELERCLTTDEEIPPSFARTIKDMFPDSSKRGSREQSRKRKSRAGH